jgi:hypothetical protein
VCVATARASFQQPYGVNAWTFPMSQVDVCQLWLNAGIDWYRVMVNWRVTEYADNQYSWNASGDLTGALNAARAKGVKLSLCVYDSPTWARSDTRKVLSYTPQKVAEFIIALLQYCQASAPGAVVAVELENENPTGVEWVTTIAVTSGTAQRDPSRYYANQLKTVYQTVKAAYPNMLVVMDAIWGGAYHHLDELYQLGCKEYFDRINVHYYTEDYMPGVRIVPTDKATVWHFPTTMWYLKYLAEQNGDPAKLIWCTEFGWRRENETTKADWIQHVLDTCHWSGFVDWTAMYVGMSRSGTTPLSRNPDDRMGLIYTNSNTTPTLYELTTAYYRYQTKSVQHRSWNPALKQPMDIILPASADIDLDNPGFETGTTAGWAVAGTVDAVTRYAGSYSCRQPSTGSIRSAFYPAEAGRLYEVTAWVKVDAPSEDSYMVWVMVGERFGDGTSDRWPAPMEYWGVVDTRYYPGTWRRIRYYHVLPPNATHIAAGFQGFGTSGTFWVDDVAIRSVAPSTWTPNTPPLEPVSLLCEGQLSPATIPVSDPMLRWTFRDGDSGDTQTGYRVIMSTDPGAIAANTGDWWDTGKVFSTDASCRYAGSVLRPGVTYYWKVATWDAADAAGPFSNAAQFRYVLTGIPSGGSVAVFPNPFDPRTQPAAQIRYRLDRAGPVTVGIYTVDGRLVKSLLKNVYQSGQSMYEISWDGKNDAAEKVVAGVYLCRFISSDTRETVKIVVQKRPG